MGASTQVSTYCLFANAVMGFGQQQLSASFSVGAALTVSTRTPSRWVMLAGCQAAFELELCESALAVAEASAEE